MHLSWVSKHKLDSSLAEVLLRDFDGQQLSVYALKTFNADALDWPGSRRNLTQWKWCTLINTSMFKYQSLWEITCHLWHLGTSQSACCPAQWRQHDVKTVHFFKKIFYTIWNLTQLPQTVYPRGTPHELCKKALIYPELSISKDNNKTLR